MGEGRFIDGAVPARPGVILRLSAVLLCLGALAPVARAENPWRTVDEHLANGDSAAAVAFAKTVTRGDAAALLRYAEHPPPDDPKTRAALAAADRILRERGPEAVLASLDGLKPPDGSVLALRRQLLRSRCLLDLRPEDSEKAAAEARRIAKELGRDLIADLGAARDRFAAEFRDLDPRQLHSLVLELLVLARAIADAHQSAQWEHILGKILVNLSLPRLALPHLRRARDDRYACYRQAAEEEKGKHLAELAMIYVSLGTAHADLGEFPKAIGFGRWSVEWSRQPGRPAEVAYALRQLGATHSLYGGYDRAIALFREARGLLSGDDPESRAERSRILLNEGNALAQIGRFEEAEPALRQAGALLEGLDLPYEQAVTALNVGYLHGRCGRWAEALRCYRTARTLAGSDPVLLAYVRMLTGDAIAAGGSGGPPGAAVPEYDAAFETVGKAGLPDLAIAAHVGRGEVLLRLGKTAAALADARVALAITEDVTSGLADEEIVAARRHLDRRRLFRLSVRCAAAVGDPSLLFEMMERSRAQAFLAAIGGRKALHRRLLGGAAAAVLDRAELALASAREGQRTALSSGDLSGFRGVQARLRRAQDDYRQALRRIERDLKSVAAAAPARTISLEEFRKSLAAGEAFVEYALLPEESWALVVTREAATRIPLPAAEELETAFSELDARDAGSDVATVDAALARLGKLLIGPLRLGPEVRRLSVSPDGCLAHLPWPVLADRALGRPVDTALVPSASVLAVLAAGGERRGSTRVALGDPRYALSPEDPRLLVYAGGGSFRLHPIPETREEVKAVSREGDERLLGPDATAENLWRALSTGGRRSAVHLACHGIVDPERPSLSALALTPDEADDGFLTAGEVYGREVPADLVVLSACRSARDPTASGEGILGLTRAFLLAGAPRVVASLWRVDDAATRAFMEAFYRAWEAPGVGAGEALRRARKETAKKRPHPAAWAGWVLWGVPD